MIRNDKLGGLFSPIFKQVFLTFQLCLIKSNMRHFPPPLYAIFLVKTLFCCYKILGFLDEMINRVIFGDFFFNFFFYIIKEIFQRAKQMVIGCRKTRTIGYVIRFAKTLLFDMKDERDYRSVCGLYSDYKPISVEMTINWLAMPYFTWCQY